MVWFFLIVGILLFGLGVGGQIRGRAKSQSFQADDLKARRWVLTVGTAVVGAWLVALSAAHLIAMLHAAGR
jgi:hypothetical protein